MSENAGRRAAGDGPFVLAIDAGSSSTRALLYDRHGQAVPGVGASEQATAHVLTDGAVEFDPDLMVERVARCIDLALAQAGPRQSKIAAVAVTTLATTLVPVDKTSRPAAPLTTYSDTRSANDAAELRRSLDSAVVLERTGCPLQPSYWPARLVWLRRTRPDVWRGAARWLTFGEYLELRLFGRCRVSLSAASWTGLLDRHRLDWDAPLLSLLGVAREQLSPLVDAADAIAGLVPSYARRWPALSDVPWFPAIGDGAAANVGSGCIDSGRVALTVGTSGAVRVVAPEVARVPAGLWCYRVDRRHALLGGATSEGGNMWDWLRKTLNLPAGDLDPALAGLQPDGHGLTVLPFLAGERSPGWAGDVRATLHGLSLATTPLAILQAGLEAVTYRLSATAGMLFDQLPGDAQVVASGGAITWSVFWLQLFADVMGRPVSVSNEAQATSRGAALLALQALGILPGLDAAPASVGRTYVPDVSRHTIYQRAMARQQALYDRLIASSENTGVGNHPR